MISFTKKKFLVYFTNAYLAPHPLKIALCKFSHPDEAMDFHKGCSSITLELQRMKVFLDIFCYPVLNGQFSSTESITGHRDSGFDAKKYFHDNIRVH